MCGITAIAGEHPVYEQLLDGLETLEYRGYDSAGVALSDGCGISVTKHEGEIDALEGGLDDDQRSAPIGIAHTRWSTHGAPSDANAHPHTDCTGSVAVVHNGIIDNYDELKTELQAEGHVFTSDTDTEVVPHLIERALSQGAHPEEAFREAIEQLSGSYAVIALIAGCEQLLAARQDSPLILGVGSGGQHYLASDVPAFLDHTDRVVYLEDGDVAVVTGSDYDITTVDGEPIERTVETVSWVPEDVERGRFDHYMIKEIHEQPTALGQTIRGRMDPETGTVDLEEFPPGVFEDVSSIQLVGCGTSYHAALYGQQFLRARGVDSQVFRAGSYPQHAQFVDEGTLVIGVTQSGETADTLAALRAAKAAGARTLALTNVVGSTAARECDEMFPIRAGPEIGVAATKTFSSQVAAFVLLAERLGTDLAGTTPDPALLSALDELPGQVESVIGAESAKRIAERYADSEAFFYIGRHTGVAVAMEGALKIKEISYEHAEAFPASELKHGPLALVTPNTPVIAVLTGDDDERTIKTIEEVRSRGAPTIVLTPERTQTVERVSTDLLEVPATHPELAGVLANVQLQLLAYHVADLLDRPIDKPRNLAKSVTVQ